MKKKTIIEMYWKAVLAQKEDEIRPYFMNDAYINWHNSNEHFTVNEFIQANCEYPDTWDGVMEAFYSIDDVVITVMNVYTRNHSLSFHVTSFIHMNEHDKIIAIDEYWGDDGEAPQWRRDLKIGTKIKSS